MTELLSAEHMFIADPSVFTVEKLLRKRKRHGSFEYLVKWRDYNFRFNTWEPQSNILDQRLLDEFEERCKNTSDLFIKEDVYDTEMSDTENNERIANRRSAPVARSTAKRTKKKRMTRSTFKLRGGREKRTPVVKYEEIENEVEEKLSDDEDVEQAVEEEEEEKPAKEETDFKPDEAEEKEEEASVSDHEVAASASPVRNLRNKKITKPVTFLAAKKRTPSSKFSSLMKRSRKQAQTYGMQFNRKEVPVTSSSPLASSAKLSSEDGDDQGVVEETSFVKITKTTKEPNKQKKKRATAAEDLENGEKKEKKQKIGSEGEEELSSKRKRPSRSCTVPSGFWDPVVKTGDSGIDSHSETEEHTFKEEDIIRAQRRMKNFEPAPSSHETCYTESPTESTNGCINDLGESVFPKKKFCLRPPTLDLSKRPISDFVFKIDDLWADKVHESSVQALGYSVKIFECRSAKTLFTKKSSKLKTGESNQEQLGT